MGGFSSTHESAERALLPVWGEGHTCLLCSLGTSLQAAVVSPAWGAWTNLPPQLGCGNNYLKKRRWKCRRVSQELILAKCVCAPWGRLVPPMGSPCNVEGIKQAGAASSDSTSKMGTGGEQPPCSRGDTPWKWQQA